MNRAVVERLTGRTAARLLAAATAWESGRLDAAELAVVLTNVIAAGRAQGATLGALSYAAWATRLSRTVVPVPTVADDRPLSSIRGAVATLLDEPDDLATRLARIAATEPARAATGAYVTAAQGDGRAAGYRRALSGGACELCTDLHAGGATFPLDKPMYRHPGCSCMPVLVAEKGP